MELPLHPFETLKAAGELPSPKGVALTIVRLCQRDDFSALQLAQVIKTDPAFVGRLIKAANGVGRNSGRPVASVEDALQVLGVSTVRALALGFSLVSEYRQGSCEAFDYEAFWSSSLVAGLVLQALSKRVGCCNPDEAFCLGLLSDVGRLALATVYGGRYGELIQFENDDLSLREEERQAFALDHDQLTAILLLDWGFPENLVEPLLLARRSSSADVQLGARSMGLMHMCAIAATVAKAVLAEGAERSWRVERAYDLGRQHGLSEEVVGGVLDVVMGEWRDWGELLSIRTLAPMRFLPPAKDGEAGLAQLAVAAGADRELLRGILLRQHYEVMEPHSADFSLDDLLSILLETAPRVLVVDAQLGDVAYAWLSTLRDTRQGREIFVAVLADANDEASAVAAMEAGADEVLVRGDSERSLAARLLAARRVVRMQQELALDREEIRNFAAELAVANRRLHEVARTDVLTGFYNRRYAMERFDLEWSGSIRSHLTLGCMMIDLDHFKQVNDRHGHDVGDQLLMHVARAIKTHLRAGDVICRIGGDEFLVICPDVDLPALQGCAQRLVDAIREIRLETPLGPLKASISVGLAVRQPGMSRPEALLKAADESMYLAKLAGRDGIAASPN